ncbi:MarR family winged helix-turn-helix transcriptional regulator [Sporolactobacillus terrae]|uniref:MarR family winged helix-turn-helix transcriptional regulator n=1 Tax=Sporolactobacillus terrae TaxID=269673 RepID=UPI000B2B5AFD|nr:MarR family transcriptional regulator [Sporolactobacillus terrae]
MDNQLCFAVYNANRLFNKFYQIALAPFHLTYAQYVVLLALWEEDGLMLHALGRRLHLESNTLTPLLKRLETAGWLIRRRSPEDKRQLFVHLTDFGRRKQSEILQAVQNCGRQTDLAEDQYRLYLKKIQDLNAALRKSIADMEAEH